MSVAQAAQSYAAPGLEVIAVRLGVVLVTACEALSHAQPNQLLPSGLALKFALLLYLC